MSLDERIPGLSEPELINLRDNAERLTKSGKPSQQAEAERLMPLILAALARRGEEKSAALKDNLAKRREATAAKAKRRKAAAKGESVPAGGFDEMD